MKYRPITFLLALIVGILVLWLSPPKPDDVAARPVSHDSASQVDPTANETLMLPAAEMVPVISETTTPVPASGPVLPQPVPASLVAMAEPPTGPEIADGISALTVMENMRTVFHQYRERFGGNPVGINREITAALNGGNARQIVFLDPEDGLRINDHGQLVDNWDTPFFFHQLSRTEMEIHSAGPDRRMWTADDLVIK